jgi:hypothetical protein
MPLPTTEQLPLLLLLVLPGFISRKVYDLRVPSESDDGAKYLLDAIFYGVLNLGLWLIPMVWLLERFEASPYALGIIGLCAFVLSPIVLANLTVLVLSSERLRKWIVHPTPTSWDYFFGQRKPCWALFRLNSGKAIAGFFGPQSFASSFPHRRDAYLQEVWLTDSEGRFLQAVPGSAGALISMDDCELVEFFEAFPLGGNESGNDE